MSLLNLPCKNCSARTDQLTLMVQLFGPRRWESIFTVCLSCLQVSLYKKQYALNEVQQTVYRAVNGVGSSLNLEDLVMHYLTINGPSKAGSIQRELGSDGVRLNDHEVAELLRRMEFRGLLTREDINWTDRVVEELLVAKKAPSKGCPACQNDRVWSLYAQMRDSVDGKESKRVVGSFCASCRSYQVDAKSLVERFVLKARRRSEEDDE